MAREKATSKEAAPAEHVLAVMLVTEALAFCDIGNLREAHDLFQKLNPHSYGQQLENTTAGDMHRKLQGALQSKGWKAQDRNELARIVEYWKAEASKQRPAHGAEPQEGSSPADEEKERTFPEDVSEDRRSLQIRFVKASVEENDDWSLREEWDAFVEW